MFILTRRRKVLLGLLFIILISIVSKYALFKNEEPPFFELESSVQLTVIEPESEVVNEDVEVVVDIKGEVINPGVYELDASSRVQDVIEKAGGATDDADLKQINLAMKIYDEMVVYIPKLGEENTKVLKVIFDGKISINQANETDLMTLNGIGSAKARAIIEYRSKNGYFKKIEDIMNVSGIGPKIFETIEDKITVH